MKIKLVSAIVIGACTSGFANAEVNLDNENDKLSYSLGIMIGESIKNRFTDLNYDALMEALTKQHKGEETLIAIPDAQATLQEFEQKSMAAKSAAAKENGEKYLAENKAKDGVKVTDSGLQYEVISEGSGPKPTAADKVSVHYTGTLIDGTKFDSSVDRGQPAEFNVTGVIPGWTEGLQLMNTGSKYRFVIPSALAYGDRGAGGAIGPGETLVFDVELLEIKK